MTLQPVVPASISDDEILVMIARIAADSLRVEPGRVTRDTSLTELGAESIDIVEITLEMENAFTVLMPEHTVLQLAAEEVGEPNPFETDGALTSLGAEMLRARMPEVPEALLAPGVKARDLGGVFTRVDTWIRLVRGLLEVSPRRCARCDVALTQGTPARVRCPSCLEESDLPGGDAIGRAWVRQWLAARG